MNEKISVIICTKNRIQDVIECIQSIYVQTLLPDEIVVVDGSDTQELNLEIKRHFNEKIKILYVHTTKPRLTRQRNIGIKNSCGEYLIFLDDDTVLDKNYIKEIIHVFDNYPAEKIGGVTGEMVTEERQSGMIKRFIRFYNQVFATIFFLLKYGDGRFRLSGSPTIIKSGSVNELTNVDFLYGCNMTFRKKIFDEFHFDEKLPGSTSGWLGEDDDVAYYTSRKYQNIYTPFAKLIHKGSPIARHNNYNKMKTAVEISYYLFKKNLPQDFKHKFAFWWAVVGLFVREGITMAVRGDSSGVRGLTKGVINILRR